MESSYTLTTFTAELALEMDKRLRDPATWQPYSWFGFSSTHERAMQGGAGPVGGPDGGKLAIVARDGTLAGQAQWFTGNWYGGAPRHRGWQIGLIVLPEHRRTSAAERALRLLIDYLFEHTSVYRIEGATAVDAVPKRKDARPAGMSREGQLRGAQWREGEWRDVVIYSILRSEWASKQIQRVIVAD